MTEEFDPQDDHRMYELEHLRSETTMIERPTTLPTSSSRPGEVTQAAPASQVSHAAHLQAEAESRPHMATTEQPSEQVSMSTVAAACIACLVAFVACYLLVRYVL